MADRFIALIVPTGLGNGSTYKMIPGIFHAKAIAQGLRGEPLPGFVESLRAGGAEVVGVPVYRWMEPEDTDEHAVETAMARLRTALGVPRLIQTVVKRGYRLALDPAADAKYADS